MTSFEQAIKSRNAFWNAWREDGGAGHVGVQVSVSSGWHLETNMAYNSLGEPTGATFWARCRACNKGNQGRYMSVGAVPASMAEAVEFLATVEREELLIAVREAPVSPTVTVANTWPAAQFSLYPLCAHMPCAELLDPPEWLLIAAAMRLAMAL